MVKLFIKLSLFVFFTHLVNSETDASIPSKRSEENKILRLAFFSSADEISKQKNIFDSFMIGFLESLSQEGFNLNHNIVFESFITPGTEVIRNIHFAKQIKQGKFNMIICLGNEQAELLLNEGIPSPNIISIDEDFLADGLSKKSKHIKVATITSLHQKFGILHGLFPDFDNVIYIYESGSKNSQKMIEKLETNKSILKIKKVVPIDLNENDHYPICLDTICNTKSIIYLSGDNLIQDIAQKLTLEALPLAIPVVSHNNNLKQTGALLSLTADITQLGRQAGELASKLVLGIKTPGNRYILPESEHLSLNYQSLFNQSTIFPNRNPIFPNTHKNNLSTIGLEYIGDNTRILLGNNISIFGKHISFENEFWSLNATNVPIFEIASEMNAIIHILGQKNKIILKGDSTIEVTLLQKSKNIKSILDKISFEIGGICNQNNQDEIICYLPQRQTLQKNQILTWIYRPHGIEATIIRQMIEKNITDISVDQINESNILVFKGTLSSLVKLRNYLLTIDIIPPEVLIELLVVEFIHGNSFSWGIDLSSGQKSKISKVVASPGNINPLTLTFNILDSLSLNFNANIKALSERNEARIITNPHLATKNGEVASLSSKEQRYIKLESYDYESNRTSYTLQELDAGVELKITPRIMADNFINLRLEGILSVFTQPSTEMNTEHIVNATQIESSVSVKDGATLIVGGLIKSESSKATRKVPVLGSIPLLGVPFKRTYNLKNIIETVIYITPHLYPVDDYESITSWTEVERILNNIKSDIDRSIRILNRTK